MSDESEPPLELRPETPAEVISRLASKDFAGLRGVVENQQVEFKDRYDLDSPRGKRDLVADIASFANAGGGIIVLGIHATQEPTTEREYCDAVTGIQPLLTEDRVGKLLGQYSHPPVKGVRVHAYVGPSTRNANDVTVQVIEVPAAPTDDKPVLVDRLLSEGGERVAHAVGWPYRDGARTEWVTAARIQQLINFGLRPQAQVEGGYPALPEPTDDFDTREGWENWGRLVLRIIPQQPQTIPDFHTTFRDLANRHWHDLRPMSFGFRLSGVSPLVNLGGALVDETPRNFLRIESHGLVTAAALASPMYLGWAQHAEEDHEHLTQLVINPYPFVEFCAETVRLAYELVGPHAKPSSWKLNGRFEHLRDRVPVALKVDAHFYEPIAAKADEVDETIDSGNDWQHDSFRLINALVGPAFGIRANDIPLLRDGVADPSTWPSR